MSRPQRDSVFYSEEEQGNEVKRILRVIDTESEIMNAALNNKDLNKAIGCCDTIGKELRTISLAPKNYYHLYLAAQNAFTPLFMFLKDEYEGSLLALYEQVQYIYYAVPRLYLMCCVGAAAVKRKAAAVNALMKDLVEMCRAVQHPTKGLFVRSYLMDMLKDKLPDGNTTGEGNGCLMDSVDFLLVNFIEMNKLTVRLQAGVRDKEKKVDEERQLLQLVSRNIQFLSNLEGMTYDIYRSSIMPRVMDQIISCGDLHAQEFLMDVVISAFPPHYHVGTLEELLRCFPSLHKQLDTRPLLLNLMKVLVNFIKNEETTLDPLTQRINIFQIFSTMLVNICKKRSVIAADFLAIMAQFEELQMAWYKDDYTRCYKQTATIYEMVSNYLPESGLDQYAITHLMRLLQLSLTSFGVKEMLNIYGFRNSISLLPYSKRKILASDIVTRCVTLNEHIETKEYASNILEVIIDLISKVQDQPDDIKEEEIGIDVENACRLLPLIGGDAEMFESILTLFKDKMTGDAIRIKYLAAPLIFVALRRRKEESLVKFIFSFVLAISKMVAKLEHYVLAFKLSLYCGIGACEAGVEKYMYFFKNAFELYENIPETKIQQECIIMAIGILTTLKLTKDDFIVIRDMIMKTIKYLIKTPMRCEMMCKIASLDIKNNSNVEDKDHCIDTLNKARNEIERIIDEEEKKKLLIMFINHYIYFFPLLDQITPDKITQIINEINENKEYLDEAQITIFTNVMNSITISAQENTKFAGIQI
ncbi:vacuolar sorting protein, putative [Entamoeba dispar SAW760]|uniref:Vacuolar sorting protein, putative n=1 Tax=Entamoeba dispar (strain ATCC PRA-260 / SAW760) TaxID=370354 RepID=B0EF59_ENTDS|nr:vacuolar sorting protein, putative [Entamoeba dispar SAW760]EDR26789.1 vacuolar sorting protein, putative [Entamoeba dispar SAW760]|eukprot:EDR26789.1 vacuolar sorting protein, putative [Entamoeba dispar SAW760]